LLGLAFFCLSQFALGLWLDHGVPLFRFTSLRAVLHRLAQRSTQPDTIVLGTSRLEGGIVESEAAAFGWTGLFNAAVPAGDPIAQEAVLEQLIASGVRPRRLIVEISPDVFTRTNFCAGWNGLRLHRWADLPVHIDQIAATNMLGRVVTARLVPAYQYRDLIWQEFTAPPGPMQAVPLALAEAEPPQWTEPNLPPVNLEQTPEQAAAVVEGGRYAAKAWLRHYQVQRVNVAALHRLVERARQMGAEVWLVTPPLSSPHRANYTPDIESTYEHIITQTNCLHLDCRDWMPDTAFTDSHHLSPKGGQLFTRRFVREVQRLTPEGWVKGAAPQR
jgi:hypothetical protein